MKHYLCVPFEKKDEAKQAGARFDKDEKKWYVEYKTNNKMFFEDIINLYDIVYLNSKYEDKDEIKSNGGKWDSDDKKWYTHKSNTLLQQFMP